MTELYWGFLGREILRDGFTSFKKDPWRNSLVVQWLGCRVFAVEGMGLIPVWEIKILKAESKPPPQKNPTTTTKPEQQGPREWCFPFLPLDIVEGGCGTWIKWSVLGQAQGQKPKLRIAEWKHIEPRFSVAESRINQPRVYLTLFGG